MSTRGASQPTAPVQGRLARVLASGLARSAPTSMLEGELMWHNMLNLVREQRGSPPPSETDPRAEEWDATPIDPSLEQAMRDQARDQPPPPPPHVTMPETAQEKAARLARQKQIADGNKELFDRLRASRQSMRVRSPSSNSRSSDSDSTSSTQPGGSPARAPPRSRQSSDGGSTTILDPPESPADAPPMLRRDSSRNSSKTVVVDPPWFPEDVPRPRRSASRDSFSTVDGNDDHAQAAGRRLSALLPRRSSSRDSFSTVDGGDDIEDAKAAGRRLSITLQENMELQHMLVELQRKNELLKQENEELRA